MEGGAAWLACKAHIGDAAPPTGTADPASNGGGSEDDSPRLSLVGGVAEFKPSSGGEKQRSVTAGNVIAKIDGVPLGGKEPPEMKEMLSGEAYRLWYDCRYRY